MKIGFIGAGKVGFSLGKFFTQGGIPVTGYYSRHRDSAQEAARFTETKVFDDLSSLVQASDALFCTVPDGAIPAVFAQLGALEIRGKQICHCSGALTAQEALSGREGGGAYYYSIHPLFPISRKDTAYQELPGAFFCLEGKGPHLQWWAETLASLGPQVRILAPEAKLRYHAACAVASNLMCALGKVSLDLLGGCGFSQEEALQALAPLMNANLAHLLQAGPVAALTGPVERCDIHTVEKHLSILPDPAAKMLYRGASQKLTELAREKHPEADYTPMDKILNGGSR
ncbi:MAG: DUF2520 domain-containing protein [Ruminiclostridium sp.]|nr:DUF2520 domain-containing protein [Ruminiclostridium sp.]